MMENKAKKRNSLPRATTSEIIVCYRSERRFLGEFREFTYRDGVPRQTRTP